MIPPPGATLTGGVDAGGALCIARTHRYTPTPIATLPPAISATPGALISRDGWLWPTGGRVCGELQADPDSERRHTSAADKRRNKVRVLVRVRRGTGTVHRSQRDGDGGLLVLNDVDATGLDLIPVALQRHGVSAWKRRVCMVSQPDVRRIEGDPCAWWRRDDADPRPAGSSRGFLHQQIGRASC